MRRGGYLLASLALLAAVATPALVGGVAPTEAVVVGGLAAWTLQAVSFWMLAGRLAEGRDAVRSWIGGMALRWGGLVVTTAGAWLAGLPYRQTGFACGAALLLLLLLEAGWLAAWSRGRARDARSPAEESASKTSGADARDEQRFTIQRDAR